MNVYICKTKCTAGPRKNLYSPGDQLLSEGPCPVHFTPEAVAPVTVETKQPETLVDVEPVKAADTTIVPRTVGELAEATGATVNLIKELTGKRQVTQVLTQSEVNSVVVALKKAE